LNKNINDIVSIIIPTFNNAKFIVKALESIINQSYINWEAIVVDNNSKDNTFKIVSNFNDTRIKYLKIENQGVIAKSRNLGIKFAKGEWIAFLDSDDWWTKDKLKICLDNINENVDFIYHDLEVIYEKPKFLFKKKNFKGRQLKKPILNDLLIGGIYKGNAIGNSSVMVRKKILIKIGGISENEDLVASEDFNTWLRIAEITDRFKYLNKRLGYYLIHETSSQKKNLSIPHRQAVIDYMKYFNDKEKLDLEVKLNYMSANFNTSINYFTEAIKEFVFVIKNGNINFKIRSFLKIILLILKRKFIRNEKI